MSTPLDTSAGEPRYLWFAGLLRRQIEEGVLKPGDRLPSRNEIRELHQIAQPTIDKAQAILEREGLIVRRERQGVFVAERDAVVPVTGGSPSVARRVASATIGILAPGEGELKPGHRQQGWSDYITQGALAACRQHGKHALIMNPDRLQGEELEHLLENPPLGLIFTSLSSHVNLGELQEFLDALQNHKLPVAVYGDDAAFEAFDRVYFDHEEGCYRLTRWLIGQGCERILPFWPPSWPGDNWLLARHRGYLRAMEEAGLEPMAIREVPNRTAPSEADDSAEEFALTTRHKAAYLIDFLAGQRGCDAILEVTDGEAASTAAACRLLGHEPNRDVLIAGFDNYWRDIVERDFESSAPAVTVDKRNWEAGRELVEVLLARVAGTLGPIPHLRQVAPELVPLHVNRNPVWNSPRESFGVLSPTRAATAAV